MAVRKHVRTLAKWLGILLMAALVLAAAAFVYLHRGFEPGGGPPAGYRNRNEILAALAIRSLPMIDRAPSLPGNVLEKVGVVYGQGGGRDLLLDLYQPKLHSLGQKFTACNKSSSRPTARNKTGWSSV